MQQWIAWLWASPNTAIGVLIGLAGLLTGGRCQRRDVTLEFYGGAVNLFLRCLPIRPAAITLGHVILGRGTTDLDRVRFHERVHVRQYERWGPLFIPAYLGWSLVLALRRRNAYWDNPFEIEAYAADAARRADGEER